ncbi:MAG: hypothetical protein RL230_2774, partial [Pseudomonadota bacterium]
MSAYAHTDSPARKTTRGAPCCLLKKQRGQGAWCVPKEVGQ